MYVRLYVYMYVGMYVVLSHFTVQHTQSAAAVEYTDWISAED